jgi:ABC-type polysaccharide/polyol phosphate transport system ATPase subunit
MAAAQALPDTRDGECAVRMKNVTKLFPSGTSRHSLFRLFMGKVSQRWTPEMFAALRSINLEVKHGDRIALIGNNGSGKSTLLRIAAGLHPPTSGTVEIRGDRTLLAGLGVGMVDELTAEDNIYLYGAMHGISRPALSERIGEILEWAELTEFRQAPLKSLSTGMRSRLAFSVTRHIVSDIYLLDEALTAGDQNFREKCDLVFKDYARSGTTMLVATHDFDFAERHCTETLWLHRGQQVSFGPTARVLEHYREFREGRRAV